MSMTWEEHGEIYGYYLPDGLVAKETLEKEGEMFSSYCSAEKFIEYQESWEYCSMTWRSVHAYGVWWALPSQFCELSIPNFESYMGKKAHVDNPPTII